MRDQPETPDPGFTGSDQSLENQVMQSPRQKRLAALKQELVGGELLTAAEVADILEINPRTVGEYIHEGSCAPTSLAAGGKFRRRRYGRSSAIRPGAAPSVEKRSCRYAD